MRPLITGPLPPRHGGIVNGLQEGWLYELARSTSPTEIRRKICNYEKLMFERADHYTEIPTEHLFAPQVYLRKVWLQAGHSYVGKIHKHEHANIISSGLVAVVTEFEPYTVYKGHCMFTSRPHTKRALVALEDTVWTCVHTNPLELRDLKDLEDYNIAKSYSELGLEDPVLLLEENV